jgi:hypothetical protein
MHWITLIGTIAFGVVVGTSLLAVFDVLFSKPHRGRVDLRAEPSPELDHQRRADKHT